MALILTVDQKVPVSVSFADRNGNPAQVQGAPVWAVSDANVLSVTASEDGMSAVVDTVGALGTAQVSVSADADLGDGVKTLVGTLDIEVHAGEAVVANVAAGAPVAK